MGSSEKVLVLIKQCVKVDYFNIEVEIYLLFYKLEFLEEDNWVIVEVINKVNFDLFWIGMIVFKQEKWVYMYWYELKIYCYCGMIGVVFDFYVGMVKCVFVWW